MLQNVASSNSGSDIDVETYDAVHTAQMEPSSMRHMKSETRDACNYDYDSDEVQIVDVKVHERRGRSKKELHHVDRGTMTTAISVDESTAVEGAGVGDDHGDAVPLPELEDFESTSQISRAEEQGREVRTRDDIFGAANDVEDDGDAEEEEDEDEENEGDELTYPGWASLRPTQVHLAVAQYYGVGKECIAARRRNAVAAQRNADDADTRK